LATNPALAERANKIIDSLDLLADAIEEGITFGLHHGQSIGPVLDRGTKEDFESQIGVRAAITRAEVANIVAIFEREDGKGSLGSLGYVFAAMKDQGLQALLLSTRHGQHANPNRKKFIEAQRLYKKVDKSDALRRVRALRHGGLAHIIRKTSKEIVFNQELVKLLDDAERIVTLLFQGFGLRDPRYIGVRDTLVLRAQLFWDTYKAGLQAREG
jgi:hypothetical protein